MATKQKSGLYRARLKIGVDPDGRDIYKYFSARTKADLERERARLQAYYIEGTGLADDTLFGPYAQTWYRTRKAPGLSASSRESYRTALNRDILPAFELRHLRAIRPLDLQEFVNRFEGRSQTKITVVFAALDGIFESACADRILGRNPMEHVRKPSATPPAEKRPLTPDERRRLERLAASGRPGAAYLALLYYLGCRPGEARGLRWGDFDWAAGVVYIQRDIDYKDKCAAGALKTRKSRRLVPVPERLAAILKPLAGDADAYVVHGDHGDHSPLAKTSGERLWVELMHACGMADPVPGDFKRKYRESDPRSRFLPQITPHALRHNYVTMCWESGIEPFLASKLAGHASIKTTMDIYTHLSDAQVGVAKTLVGKMFGEGGEDRDRAT